MRSSMGVTSRRKGRTGHVDLGHGGRAPSNKFQSQRPAARGRIDIPLGLDDAVAVQVPTLAAVELDAADKGNLGRGRGRVVVVACGWVR